MLRSGLDKMDASGALGRYLMRHCNAMLGFRVPVPHQPRVRESQAGVHHRFLRVGPRHRRDGAGRDSGHVHAAARRGPRAGAARLPLGGLPGRQPHPDPALRGRGRTPGRQPPGADAPRSTAGTCRSRRSTTATRSGTPAGATGWSRWPGACCARAGGVTGKVRLIDSFSHAVGTARFGLDPDGVGAGSPLPLLGVAQPVRRRRLASCRPQAA